MTKKETILHLFGVKDVKEKEVGIEIEMEGKSLFNTDHRPIENWKIVHDNSLRGESQEYVLCEPVTRHKVVEVLQSLQSRFEEIGSKLTPSDRCGVHVHINCQTFSTQEVINFATLYYIFEGLLMRWCGEDREGNIFTMRLKDAEATIPELINAQIHNNLSDLQCDNFRYSSLNFSSLSKYGSLEFRGMRTPRKLLNIMVWVEMLLMIKDRSMVYSRPKDIIEAFSVIGAEGFLTHIMEDHAEVLMFHNFERTMYESARLIQDIAYCEPLAENRRKGAQAWMMPLVYDRWTYKRIVQGGYDPENKDDHWPSYNTLEAIPISLRKEGQRIVLAGWLATWVNNEWIKLRHRQDCGYRRPNQQPGGDVPQSGIQPGHVTFTSQGLPSAYAKAKLKKQNVPVPDAVVAYQGDPWGLVPLVPLTPTPPPSQPTQPNIPQDVLDMLSELDYED